MENKIEVEKMSKKEIDAVSAEIGKKINAITARAIAEANLLLEPYGVNCKMQIVIEEVKIAESKQASSDAEVISKDKKMRRKSKKNAAS